MPDTGILKFNTGTFKLVNARQSKHRSKGVLSLGIDASEEASKREVTLRNEQLMTRVLEIPETAILCTIQAQECSVYFLIYCFFIFFSCLHRTWKKNGDPRLAVLQIKDKPGFVLQLGPLRFEIHQTA